MVAVLEAVRETVDVRVVDEGVVAISPGELLGPIEMKSVYHRC